jgi:hypothetical protein
LLIEQDSLEPSLDEVLNDPIIRLMMKSDNVTEAGLRGIIAIARRHLDRNAVRQRRG